MQLKFLSLKHYLWQFADGPCMIIHEYPKIKLIIIWTAKKWAIYGNSEMAVYGH